MYASFQDYTERFRGRAIRDEADFNRLALRADAVLNRLTLGRALRYRDTEGKLAMACCAVTEKLFELEESRREHLGAERIAAEKVGSYRVQYHRYHTEETMAELDALAELYLFGTGLLYRGIPVETWEEY